MFKALCIFGLRRAECISTPNICAPLAFVHLIGYNLIGLVCASAANQRHSGSRKLLCYLSDAIPHRCGVCRSYRSLRWTGSTMRTSGKQGNNCQCCKWRSSLRVRCVLMAPTLPVFGYGAAFSITYHPPGMEALARSIHCPTVCTYLLQMGRVKSTFSSCVGPLSCQFLTVTAGTNCRHPPEPGVACNNIAIAGFPNVGSFGFAGKTTKLPRHSRVRFLG